MLRIGLDIGSTTIKCVVLDEENKILYSDYQRHLSQVSGKALNLLKNIKEKFNEPKMQISVSGSAGMGFAQKMDIPFVQEVFATRTAVKTLLPETDTVIELGGEDAKILFLSGITEFRMNGTCAGGTGSFIDQMATLLKLEPIEMNMLAQSSKKIYNIASRCGVFAKSDIQPLLNQGATKEDISASIFEAVVNQTIAGLAQGRTICGNVVYLGGPLTFLSELRKAFDKGLKLKGTCPENSLYFVAFGTALGENKEFDIQELINNIQNFKTVENYDSMPALFENQEEYNAFASRHHIGEEIETFPLKGKSYIGIDAGSTTLKAVLINEDSQIVHYKYMSNGGTPVPLVKSFLEEVYEKFPNINIGGVASTGYGEEIIKKAFHADFGIVETIAHFTGAKFYNPKVDFIIDIGGQDIKCFKIRNHNIDNIFLNEACSSGCGSFLQTFAQALGYSIEEFSKLGVMAKKPVNLGSRCTVFMNSSVKQAQKDGAGIDNISAGLSMSVVKNALYKVIRISSKKSIGENIVVQGGTFLNDAVLRAFEKEIGTEVTRPNIAGLMGAFGCALFAKNQNLEKSKIMSKEDLENFTHEVSTLTCAGCTNHCKLTVNKFHDGSRFISGNRCEKPLNIKNEATKYNLYDYKTELLKSYMYSNGSKATIGLPMALNMFELLPFWHTFFRKLGFGVRVSNVSTKELYLKGQHTISSDTVCYPAKLVHGHIEDLLQSGVDAIFYPCMTYNLDEGLGDNHYNCPVVAYYPEVIGANVNALDGITYMNDYLGLHRRKDFPKKILEILNREFGGLTLKEVQQATSEAFLEYNIYMKKVEEKGKEYIEKAKEKNLPVIVLAGRPYHLDPEINHGIDKLICDCGAVLVTEDAIAPISQKPETNVLNQWTYHSRLYASANYVSQQGSDMNLVQLVSFGCGVDAITTDEVRKIMESKGKIYTQIKIDEITNLGAVKIRLRSLFAAINQEKSHAEN